MTQENQIISKLQTLKQIKPRQEWVISVKRQILNTEFAPVTFANNPVKNILSNIFKPSFQKNFVYAFAVFLFMIVGAFGFMKINSGNSNTKIAQQPAVELVAIKNTVETFKETSKNLSQVAQIIKTNPQNISPTIKELAVNQVKDAAQKLTDAIKSDPQLAKNVALDVNNNKTYLDVLGGNNLNEVTDAYKTIDEQLLKDANSETLTPEKKTELNRIEAEFSKGDDYSSVLRDLLILMNSAGKNSN